MPPPAPAGLPESVLLVMVSVPWFTMPPPKPSPQLLAALPERVLLITVSVPALWMPPPASPPQARAELPERMLSVTVVVPKLMMPPPPSATPFWMVRPEMATVPLTMLNTRDEWLPLIAKLEAPGPLIVRSLLITSSPEASVIVAGSGRLKSIVPPGATLAIASRSEPIPLLFVFVTAIDVGGELLSVARKTPLGVPA